MPNEVIIFYWGDESLLLKYEDFVNRVEELGFMAFSGIVNGLPSLVGETPMDIWHTGDTETDPWCWKDRVAEEKRLAFGCILGGNKGFIAPRLYPVFLAACRTLETMEERRYNGLVSQTAWELWKLFEEKRVLDTGEIRRYMGVTRKKGSSKVDSAMAELQQLFYITVAGSRQKTDKYGQPYGWHVNVYERVEDWMPGAWNNGCLRMDREEAIQEILDTAVQNGQSIDSARSAKVLGFKR